MDKFAVDLEKVLDDFEINEGREEDVVSQPPIKHCFQHVVVSQKTLRPPAASYRRPAFEPINLADADFAAAPIPTPPVDILRRSGGFNVHNGVSEEEEEEDDDNNDEPYPREVVEEELRNGRKEDPPVDQSPSEDTPDILDSNTLKPIQTNSVNITELSTQLPDVTSSTQPVVIISSDESSSDEPPPPASVFDLIRPGSAFDEGLPPIVDVRTLVQDELPSIQIDKGEVPLRFGSVEVSESELEDYLSTLEESEPPPQDSHINLKNSPDDDVEILSNVCLDDMGNLSVNGTLESVPKEEDVVVPSHDILPKEDVRLPENDKQLDSEPLENIKDKAPGDVSHMTGTVIPESITEYRSPENIDTEHEEIENTQNEERASVLNPLPVPSTVLMKDTSNDEPSDGYYDPDGRGNLDGGEAGVGSDSDLGDKPLRPNTLPLASSHIITDSEESPTPTDTRGNGMATTNSMISPEERNLGKVAPFWVPDSDADNCMQCHNKFTVIKRRHHCRACGLVLCSKCCSLRTQLEYLDFQEVRVCQSCYNIIYKVNMDEGRFSLGRQPNPNNPMEYCSTIPPHQQAAKALLQPPPSVLVPTGVLKREGRAKSDVPKQVMFSDGIRPGGDLTELDGVPEFRLLPRRGVRRLATPPGKTVETTKVGGSVNTTGGRGANNFIRRPLNPTTKSFIPNDSQLLPPVVIKQHGQLNFCDDVPAVTDQVVKYAINYNLFVNVKRVKLDCCMNRDCWSICSEGLVCVGQDEVAMVLECMPDEPLPPQDVFHLVNTLHQDAAKGTSVSEMVFTSSFSPNLFGSKDHGGFLYIRPTLQCTTQLLLPAQPYLFAILVHRWEIPWARLFPLRLVLRLGAEYRYYPTPLVSIRNRPPLYTDIGRTIMKILVDFRKYSYSLATVRGLLIHMEDRQSTILFPRNRYDQVVRALNNSNDSVLAFGANLSLTADSHLVCIQSTQDENTYQSQAINIHNKPRRVTGASFVVFNGALKTAGLSGKSSITEDGLMVHLPSDSMLQMRTALKDMKDYTISCGPNDEETVLLKWTDDDTNFNIGVKSCIDGRPLDGVPSIRVHNGTDFQGNKRIIRWTEVFILQCEDNNKTTDPLDINKVSESLAHATCFVLAPVLDLLAESDLITLAVRATIHPENVGYEAGSCGEKLPSQYMQRLDDELIHVVSQAAISAQDSSAVLELIFRVMNHP